MPVFNLRKNVDFLHGVTLPGATYTHSDALQVREGAGNTTWDMLSDMNDYSGFQASAASDINPNLTSVAITLWASTDSGATYADVTSSGVAVDDIIPNSDVTIGTSSALSDLEATVALGSGTISANVLSTGTARFQLRAAISND